MLRPKASCSAFDIAILGGRARHGAPLRAPCSAMRWKGAARCAPTRHRVHGEAPDRVNGPKIASRGSVPCERPHGL